MTVPCATCTGCHAPAGAADLSSSVLPLPRAVAVAVNQPVGAEHVFGGVFVKSWEVADAGTILPQHSHPVPHMTFVASGAVRVWRDGTDLGEFHAPAAVQIPAFAQHGFLTLKPGTTMLCLFNVTDSEGGGLPPIHEENSLLFEEA